MAVNGREQVSKMRVRRRLVRLQRNRRPHRIDCLLNSVLTSQNLAEVGLESRAIWGELDCPPKRRLQFGKPAHPRKQVPKVRVRRCLVLLQCNRRLHRFNRIRQAIPPCQYMAESG